MTTLFTLLLVGIIAWLGYLTIKLHGFHAAVDEAVKEADEVVTDGHNRLRSAVESARAEIAGMIAKAKIR